MKEVKRLSPVEINDEVFIHYYDNACVYSRIQDRSLFEEFGDEFYPILF